MKVKKTMKRVYAWILSICMIVATMWVDSGMVQAADGDSTTVYFYNSDGWGTVGAHAWSDAGDLTGAWGSTTATASDIGEGWYELTLSSAPAFNVIFFDTAADANRSSVYFADTTKLYAGVGDKIYASASEAIAAANSTTVYFYNSDNWATVGVHGWSDAGDLTGGWGSTTATASDIGDGWYEITISSLPGFNLIFFDKDGDADANRSTVYFADKSDVYAVLGDKAFASKGEAEGEISGENAVTKVYFHNTDNWTTVGVHGWSDAGDLTGGWGSTTATASDIGDGWYEIIIQAVPGFNLIFFDKDGDADANRSSVYIEDKTTVYVTKGDSVYESKFNAESALGLTSGTTVYFLNSGKWETVGAHAYNTSGGLTGGWGSTAAEPATELGGDWVKVNVPAEPAFNIIFYNKAKESERAEAYIEAKDSVYVNMTAEDYKTKEEAEEAFANLSTTIYFFNFDGEDAVFEQVYAYPNANDAAVADAWPGIKATEATELGENWWKADVPQNAFVEPFSVIFSDNGSNQLAAVDITNYTNNYVTANAELYANQNDAEASVGIVNETVVYYFNTEGWEEVIAYVYGDCGEALGGWGQTLAEPAPELGDMWIKAVVPANPKFNIIFSDKSDTTETIRANFYIQSDKAVYGAGCLLDGNVAVYGSQEEAELAMGLGNSDMMTTIYFYNSRGWGDINCYASRKDDGEQITVGNSWPGKAAEKATEIGENWWKASIPRTPVAEDPLYVIFNDGVNQTQDVEIPDKDTVYVTVTEKAFKTAAEAEAEAAKDTYDDGCEDGPNEDLDNYEAEYDGPGAELPYVSYEAEDAKTNAIVLEKDTVYRNSIQTEASGRQAVELKETNDYVEFTLTEATNTLVLRYSMPDSADGEGIDATLSLYIDGKEVKDLALTSKYAWVYGAYPFNNNVENGKAHRFFDETRIMLGETLPAGTTIRLQKDTADKADYYVIDFIECELVAAPLTQPANSLSVTEFGAVANDGKDDYQAFVDAIAAAKKQGKEVWIPAGTFDLVEEKAIKVAGVTIRGAGMWYTNLRGEGVSFRYEATCKFYDFAMTGLSTFRDDGGDLAGFQNAGKASNVTIENIWMEHMKVGVWSENTERLVVQGCRIRNTYADGINVCSGTNNSTVRNNSLRNTGDDSIAIWPWLADCSGNTITHNTIQVPTLANGIAIYGGGLNVADSNHVMDTIFNGSGITISSEFDSVKGHIGTITVKNNLLERCGSYHEEGYPVGAIWIWASKKPMTHEYNVYSNVMKDCLETGITVEAGNKLTGLNIMYNTIDGATDAIYEYLGEEGSGKYYFEEGAVKNITGVFLDDTKNPDFTWTEEKVALEVEDSIQDVVTKGDVDLDVDQENADKILNEVLTDAEKELAKRGINVGLKFVTTEMKPSKEEDAVIKSILGRNMVVGICLDIDLFKVVGYTNTQLEELKTPAKVTITIPLDYLADGRMFSLAGVHDGKAELYKDLDNNAATITVELDKYSTYALVYEDASQPENQLPTENPTQTGDNAPVVVMAMVLVLAAGAVVVTGRRRQKAFN